jgi:hypothetical protein
MWVFACLSYVSHILFEHQEHPWLAGPGPEDSQRMIVIVFQQMQPGVICASHKPPHELRLGAVEVPPLRGNPVPVLKGLGDQFVEVLPLLSIVVDELGEAVAEVVTVEGEVELVLID